MAKDAAAKVMEGTAKMVPKQAITQLRFQEQGVYSVRYHHWGLLEDAGVRGSIARAVEEAANISASFAKK